ncbi:MAG: hypothetical protein QGF78_01595 [Candidatus Bathyarchaeota archaeon]|jgi:hypothetical protein|nr:hypothetical protein [Candidatus Bathyarchaeota archaeon]MDP6458014.1 hypothetical protein [Candidatus Bathyarchaeota archaeon]
MERPEVQALYNVSHLEPESVECELADAPGLEESASIPGARKSY